MAMQLSCRYWFSFQYSSHCKGMCSCETMASSIRDEKITEFFQTVFRNHADPVTGKVTYQKLGRILASLGRKIGEERLMKIKKKFNVEDKDDIDLSDPDFIMTVASLNVVDVKAIEDSVFSTAFKIFDMVSKSD